MGANTLSCPKCGSERVTTIRLLQAGTSDAPPTAQTAFRCLACDTHWMDHNQEPSGE